MQSLPLPEGERSVALAHFRTAAGFKGEAVDLEVHFNPATLTYTLANTIEQGKGADKKKQFVSATSAKLKMELVFDTTHTGQDVRIATERMEKLLKPSGPDGKKVPPVVEFSWGSYAFSGIVEQYEEAMDFFSNEGVPLRAGVKITLAQQDAVFASGNYPVPHADSNAPQGEIALAPPDDSPRGGAAGLANALGDPRAARGLAALNGSDSLRFSSGVPLAVGVGGGIELQAAAAFSVGGGAGFGLGIGGGAGIGMSAGIGVGGGASAGVALGIGAGFAGLRSAASSSVTLPSARAALSLTSAPVAGAGLQFGLGGRAQAAGGSGFSADVGAAGDARAGARLEFGS